MDILIHLRVFLLVLLMGVIISSAVASRYVLTGSLDFEDLESTRSALLAFSIIGFLTNLAAYLIAIFQGLNFYKRYPILLIIIVMDILVTLGILGASIGAAIAESKFTKGTYRKGAYGAAAGFGFASFLVYLVIIVFGLLNSRSNSVSDTE